MVDIALQLQDLREKYTMATPDKSDTPWAVLTRAIELLTVPADLPAKIAEAIAEADAEFRYSIELIRLVDGVSTYRLTMPGIRDEYPDYDEASQAMQAERAKDRADRVLAVIRPDLKASR